MKFLSQDEILSAARPYTPRRFVYFLILNDVVVYVGKSETPLGRIASHSTRPRFKFNAYHLMELPENVDADEVERHYIHTLRPILNAVRIMPSSFVPTGDTTEERIQSRIAAGQAPGSAAIAEGMNSSTFYQTSFYQEVIRKGKDRRFTSN
jgi:hypothetical protein